MFALSSLVPVVSVQLSHSFLCVRTPPTASLRSQHLRPTTCWSRLRTWHMLSRSCRLWSDAREAGRQTAASRPVRVHDRAVGRSALSDASAYKDSVCVGVCMDRIQLEHLFSKPCRMWRPRREAGGKSIAGMCRGAGLPGHAHHAAQICRQSSLLTRLITASWLSALFL